MAFACSMSRGWSGLPKFEALGVTDVAPLDGDLPSNEPWRWFFTGARTAFSGPAFYVALSLMGVGGLARAAGFPIGAAMLSTLLVWAGPGQLLFFGAVAAKMAPPAIALAVSLSSVRLLPMVLSVLPMLRGR